MNRATKANGRDERKSERIERLMDLIRTLMEEQFTGYVKVNFSQGGIGRIEKFEEILK